ncbi:hypothetical protein KWH04_21140 [Xanthomonas campestris pv. trichodesmae]|uniref:3-isopropylmalate dehydratase n=2 Tax=Xanthomonas citri TaxID=346 RepID=A0AB33CMA2_XANCI|nr:hypothetical protein [Xanthomonas citri]MBV6783079.1 hypothetical protein [Xanthomonas campestris pv. trichodesmae]ASK94850.1 hypothetical protein XcvCFBP7111P_25645 [Xanthomonas citri pv. vignicola]ASK94892.1 hypothetical protein XcvCFBP7111P_25920 [Xanthomonas citri pv. vignicola]MBZ3921974.1 hypothetical protein [Xanthomonas campestris pv. trichodesmae]MBZ3925793.1 hypothetical protein [Xanthomonas citri pv. sesbaniae]
MRPALSGLYALKLVTLAFSLLATAGYAAATECSNQALTIHVEVAGGTHGQLELSLRDGFAKPFKAGRELTPEAFEGLIGTAWCEGRSIVIEANSSFAFASAPPGNQRQRLSLPIGSGGAVVQQVGSVKITFVSETKPRPAPRRSMSA